MPVQHHTREIAKKLAPCKSMAKDISLVFLWSWLAQAAADQAYNQNKSVANHIVPTTLHKLQSTIFQVTKELVQHGVMLPSSSVWDSKNLGSSGHGNHDDRHLACMLTPRHQHEEHFSQAATPHNKHGGNCCLTLVLDYSQVS